MKTLALAAIRFYQRHMSPHKGFCCAYANYSGHASCSVLGYRAIRRFGAWQGLFVLNARLEKCGIAYRRSAPSVLQRQAGVIDGGVCEAIACGADACNGIVTAADVCSGCGWKERRARKGDANVVIPERGKRRQE